MLKHLRQLASESLVYGLSGAISRFLAILIVPITTRVLSPEEYGISSLVMTTLALCNILMVLGLDSAVFRWFWDTEDIAARKSTFATWAWCQLLVGAFLAITLVGGSGVLAQALIGNRRTAILFLLAAAALPLNGPGLILLSWLRCQRRVWATVFYTVTYTSVNILLTLVFVVWLRMGNVGLMLAQVASAAVRTTIALALMRDWLHPRYFRVSLLRQMLSFSMPLVPAGVALWTMSLADRYFLRYFGSTQEVGLYQVGASIAAFLALVVSAFTQAWGPFALSIHKEEHSRDVYASVFLGYTWLACLGATGITLLAPEALRILTRPAYYSAAPVVGLLAIGWVMEGHYYLASVGPTLMRQTRPVGIAVGLAAVITIILNILLIPRWGMLGAATAYMGAYSARAAYLYWRSQQMYKIPYRFGAAVVIVAVAGFLMYAGSWIQGLGPVVQLLAKMALLLAFLPLPFLLRIVSFAQARRLMTPSLATADR